MRGISIAMLVYQRVIHNMGVSKNRGKNPKMDGENNGKPYFSMDDLGGKPTIFGNIFVAYCFFKQPPMFEGIHKIQFL